MRQAYCYHDIIHQPQKLRWITIIYCGILLKIEINPFVGHIQTQHQLRRSLSIVIILNSNDSILLCLMYRIPNSLDTNNNQINKIIDELCIHNYNQIILVGDVNQDILNNRHRSSAHYAHTRVTLRSTSHKSYSVTIWCE